jgi:DNA-binding MarR family transcriptional regulator
LLAGLAAATRKGSAQGVLFGQAVAERIGITPSDLECLDIVVLNERVTAGELARATGLTTGAITGVLDRLETAGYVRRERDVADRRKVFVRAVPAKVRRIEACYRPLEQAWFEALKGYTDDELRLLVDFAERGHRMMVEQTARLRATPRSKPARRAPSDPSRRMDGGPRARRGRAPAS